MQLEYYKLQKTFAGTIELEHAKGVYEPVTQKGALGHDLKEPLDEIILKINEKFKGEFTNTDRVLLTATRAISMLKTCESVADASCLTSSRRLAISRMLNSACP